MNARNIALVFAPNMTEMSDPLTALMHAVQVMNLLKTSILKTLREREETSLAGDYSPTSSGWFLQGIDELIECEITNDEGGSTFMGGFSKELGDTIEDLVEGHYVPSNRKKYQ